MNYALISIEDEMKNYEFHGQNVASLMRLQKYLSPAVLEFCAPLGDLNNVLTQIQMNPPQPVKHAGLMIESEPQGIFKPELGICF